MNLKNDLLLRAAKGEKVERIPVWLMRQAGRVLPEYRSLRSKLKDFKELVKTPQYAAEATIQPVDILEVDAAIIFSDILVIPEAMGLNYEMIENKGPWFERTIRTSEDIDNLNIAESDNYNYVLQAIKLSKKELNGRVPLIGFGGAPWTILSYMIEGQGSKTFSQAKKFLYTQPEQAHRLLDKITRSTINYLTDQVKAGADIIQIFDSWAGVLSPAQYEEFSLKYISRICDVVHQLAPVIVFAKGAFFARKQMGRLSCNVVGLDWNMEITESRELIGWSKTLQGNMDPCLLYANTNTIKKETIKMLETFGSEKYIANLGHGLYPDISKDNVKCFVDTVKSYNF